MKVKTKPIKRSSVMYGEDQSRKTSVAVYLYTGKTSRKEAAIVFFDFGLRDLVISLGDYEVPFLTLPGELYADFNKRLEENRLNISFVYDDDDNLVTIKVHEE